MEENQIGYLELIIGPMFSGKTSRLIEIYKQQKYCQQNPIVINFSGDNRYSDHLTHVSSHDNIKIPCLISNLLSNIFDIKDVLNDKIYNSTIETFTDFDKIHIYKCLYDKNYPHFCRTILINEGQFFPDLYEWVTFMTDNLKKKFTLQD